MADLYWWSCYGNFEPGEGVLPHMGQVVAQYRREYGCKTQAKFAIAAGVTERTVIDWERLPMIPDLNRRIFLAKMLKIPPALLGLDWRLVYYQDNQGTPVEDVPPEIAIEIAKEESYYLYEDTLVMAWGWYYAGKVIEVADRFERRLHKLEQCVERAPFIEKEAWLGLLCQYYDLDSHITRHRGTDEASKRRVLLFNSKGLQIAKEIEDQELLAHLWLARASIHEDQERTAKARITSHQALQAAEKINTHTSLYGHIQIITAPILLPEMASDTELLRSIRRSGDRVLELVQRKKVEPDRSFMYLNLAGVHHERAKLFLGLHKLFPKQGYLKDASNEMRLAWDNLTPEFTEWELYFHLTEATLYKEQNELEQSAQSGIEALKVVRMGNSKRKENAIVALYRDLRALDENNSYVCNLGVQLGLF